MPVGVPVPALLETMAVKVTDWPKTEGLVEELIEIAVLDDALWTTQVKVVVPLAWPSLADTTTV